MTLIVAHIDSKGSYIASDRMGSNGHSGGIYRNNKVFKIGNDILAGGCGSYKELQLLEKDFTPPKREVGQSSSEYMYGSFVHALKKFLKEHGVLYEENGISKNKNAEFIFIYDKVIYKWQSDLALLETVLDYDTTGSGEEYARAVMHTLKITNSKLSPRQKLKLAVDLTSQYVISVGGEPVIVEMKHDTSRDQTPSTD